MMHAESGSEAVVTCLLEAHAFIDTQDKVNNIIIIIIYHTCKCHLIILCQVGAKVYTTPHVDVLHVVYQYS